VSKREGVLKASLKEAIERALPHFVVISHTDIASGIPDWSITGNGITSWLELKHATPEFTSRGIQVVTASRLAAAGHCRYLVFWERSINNKRTCIVHPGSVVFGRNATTKSELFSDGHDNEFVIDYLRKVHRV